VKDKRRDLRAYRRASARLKRQAKAKGWPCYLCGEPIDFDADYRDRRSFTADHVDPLAAGGAILGPLRPAHRGCNSRRGDARHERRIPTTREW
jgi:hypothetical protein